MALTAEEKQLVLTSTYFGMCWGVKDKGMCPAGRVGELRGVKFSAGEPIGDTYYDDMLIYDLANKQEAQILWQAVDDVAAWFGFNRHEYMNTLEREGEKILERAPKE